MPASDHGDPLLHATEANGTPIVNIHKSPDHLSPGTAIASSPIMKDIGSSPLRFLNEKARASQASSFRLSSDVSKLRWDGSELPEEELREGDDGNAELDDHSAMGDFDGDMDNDDADRSKEELEAMSYSTLSKRADFILAHAKKKLNLLEGNLGKARHSLGSQQPTPELRTTSSLSNYASPALVESLDENSRTVKISPRINFGTPRHLRNSQTPRSPSGHNRMFSDTSVPSPAGATIKGSRGLEHIQNGDLREEPVKEEVSPVSQGSGLNTVMEDEEVDKGSKMQNLRELYGAASPPPKSTQELRDQAEELRSRIAFLQKRSQDDAARGQYLANDSAAERTEHAFMTQVHALERSLEDQEEVIEQLESAERTKQVHEDPRGEWQQVLEQNQARRNEDGFSDDEYFDEDYDDHPENLPDVLGDEEVDETKAMAAAHEDRADAFDYETFILHSAMGRGIARSSSPDDSESQDESLSEASEGSIETERGAAYDEGEMQAAAGGEEQRRSWDDIQQMNDSVASLTTTESFETANEDVGSEFGSDGSEEQQHEDLLGTDIQNPWPMPPQPTSADGQRTMFRDSEIPTPKAGGFPQEQLLGRPVDTGRPLSTIFQTLLVPEDESELPRTLDKDDENLIRCCAESLRSVCMEAIHPSTSPRDMKALRERLEVAKRVLNGEL